MTALSPVRRAPWLYRIFLKLLPETLRRRHGFDMEELFLVELESARRAGGISPLLAWARGAADAASATQRGRGRTRDCSPR